MKLSLVNHLGNQLGTPSQCFSGVLESCVILMSALAVSAQTIIPPEQWGTMQTVAGNDSGSLKLYYPFTGAATKPDVVTCQFQPSSYSPGSYQAGYCGAGMVALEMGDGHTDGNVIMDMMKYYTANWDPAYTEILIGNDGRTPDGKSGIYSPGGLYSIKFTFNRPAGTIQIDVTGPTSASKAVSSNGRDITQLTFYGPNYSPMGSSSFGNVVVQAPIIPPPPLILSGYQRNENGHVLSFNWTNSVACLLESSESLTGEWSPVTSYGVTNGNWVSTQVTSTNSTQFFRLRSP